MKRRESALRRLRLLQKAIVDREEQGETLRRMLPGGLAEKLRDEAELLELRGSPLELVAEGHEAGNVSHIVDCTGHRSGVSSLEPFHPTRSRATTPHPMTAASARAARAISRTAPPRVCSRPPAA